MDDKKILALLAAVKNGSLSKAAEELDYTQPGLTQMMNCLESEIGCQLLSHNHSGIKLTTEGTCLLPYIQDVATSMKRLRDKADQIRFSKKQILRIGTYPSIAKSLLPHIIKEFQLQNPTISIEICVGAYDIGDWLNAGTIDLAFVDESLKKNGKWTSLIEESFFVALHRSCPLGRQAPVSVQQLVEYPFIMSQYNELKPLMTLCRNDSIREQIQINATDDTSLLSLVEQGLGLTVLPASALKDHSELIRVVGLDPPIKRVLGIVLPKSPSTQTNSFAAFIKKEVMKLE